MRVEVGKIKALMSTLVSKTVRTSDVRFMTARS
jgi:hypothetical protein